MQSTGHSSMHALSSTSTHGSAMMYVTGLPLRNPCRVSRGRCKPSISSEREAIVLGSRDLGWRVVVRRRAGIRDGRPVFRDVIGQLIEITGSHLVVARDDGLVRI